MKRLIFLLFLLSIFPINTRAIHEVIDARCTTDIKVLLREEAQDVVYRLSKNDNEENIIYSAYFYNLTDNIYIEDANGNIINDAKLENLKPGSSIMINIYASNNTYCEGYKAGSKIIKVPYYNPYVNSELCKGHEEYLLCSESTNVNLSKEEFESKIKEYIASLEKEEEEPSEIEEKGFNIFDFILEYKYLFIAGASVIVVTILFVLIKRNKKEKGIL